jgi:PAS domain S-box-containing protein
LAVASTAPRGASSPTRPRSGASTRTEREELAPEEVGRILAVPALHKDGRQISIEFSIQLLKDAAGQIEWVVAVIRDVTARYAREKALRAQLKGTEPNVA